MESKIDSERLPSAPNAAPAVARSDVGEHQNDAGQCSAVKADGQCCHARAQVGTQWCYFHDPESTEERIAASRRGGEKNRSATLPLGTPDFPLTSAADASALIGRTINQLLRGEIDPRIANTVGYLVTVKIKATDQGALERRVAALEATLLNTHAGTKNGGSL